MSFIKKQSAGSFVTLLTLILTIASVITYYVNIGGEGYFQNASVSTAILWTFVAAVLLIAVLVLAQLQLPSKVDTVLALLSDAMRIVTPVCLIAAAMMLVSARVEGFAFIYFSNEEVLQEVQTAANMSSAHGAIANIVILAVTAPVGIAAAFFNLKKKA